jgi:hypothetical protein
MANTIVLLVITDSKCRDSARFFIVSPLMYEIIRCYHIVPSNLKCSGIIDDVTEFMTIPEDVFEFMNRDELDYIREYCGIPNLHKQPNEETIQELNNIPLGQFVNPELYMHIDKPIAPDIITLNGVRV